MNIFDRITLLRAGYTRKEIDAMIEEDMKAAEEEKAKLQDVDRIAAESEKTAVSAVETEDAEENTSAAPEPDYKRLYEAQTEALERAQAANRTRDNKGKDKDPHEVLQDIVSSFM